MWLNLLLLILPLSIFGAIVETDYGEVEGFEHVTPEGVPIHVFLGIRYGQSPDVDLRFQKAELVEKWAPYRHSAKQFRAACIPFHEKGLNDETFAEDCLFLNIMTPSISTKDLPVLVFVHGGAFELSSSRDYGYKTFAEKIASQGIVVVTIQYRLGPFGFFSLGDSVAPGNMGYWDQTLALHFLHEILPSFGGDASRITLMGHSAGAVSVSALQFSPHSNSLFNQAFLMSGSALTEWGMSEAVVEESKKLAKELNCLKGTSTGTMECLREATPMEILDAVDKIGSTRYHPNFAVFHPRHDGDFFPFSIERLASSATKKNTVMGVTDHESATMVLFEELSFLFGTTLNKTQWDNFSREDLIKYIETAVVTDHEHTDHAGAFRRLLIEFYVEREEKKGDSAFYIQRFTELASDLQFIIPMYHEAQIKLANDWPTWLYVIEHETKSFDKGQMPVGGAYHGDEMNHLTDSQLFYQLDTSIEEDAQFGRAFVGAIVAFAKTGDPSTKSFKWPRATKEQPFQHAAFSHNPEIRREAFRSHAAKLWLTDVPKSVSGEALRRSRLPGAEAHIVHTEL